MIDHHDTNTIDFLAQRPRPVAANEITIDLTETRRPAVSATPTVPTTEPAVAGELMPAGENSKHRQGGDLAEGELIPAMENTQLRHGAVDERESALAFEFGINLQQSSLELVQDAALSMGKAATLLVKSGLELLAAQAQAGDGNFRQFLAEVGIPERRAFEAISYARFAAQLPDSQRSRYLMLPKKSAFLLGNADPEVIELLLDDENISKTSKLRTRTELSELARALTETEDELETTKAQNEALEEELLRLRQANEAKVAGSEYPLHVVTLRKESSILADEANACLSSIRTHVEEFLLKTEDDHSHAAERNFDAGLMPALANLVSILRSGMSLLNYIEASTGVSASDTPALTTRFSPAELELIEAAREDMLARKEGKSLMRQSQYAANGELKRNRGRPKKLA